MLSFRLMNRRWISLLAGFGLMIGVFHLATAQDNPAAEETPSAEATSEVIGNPPTVEATPEATDSPPTVEATVEFTENPPEPGTTEIPATEATAETTEAALETTPTAESTEAAILNLPPAFDLTTSTFNTVPGVPLVIEFNVSDEAGIVRVVEDVSATLGGVKVDFKPPEQTAAPFITPVIVTYLPMADYAGTDSFMLTAVDASGGAATVTVTIQVGLAGEATAEATLEITPEITPEVTETPDAILTLDDTVMAAGEQTFVVNSTDDEGDANTSDGICQTTTIGECTLRAAVEQANAIVGADTINFNLPGGGVKTIRPTSSPLTIVDTVTIDGYSQPGSAVATNTAPANLLIALDGDDTLDIGLVIAASNSKVKGLAIYSFTDTGIEIAAGGARIEGNHVGTDAAGTLDLGNGFYGIRMVSAPNGIIGGLNSASRNVISGNDYTGILIGGSGASNNQIQGNYIGTNAAGTAALGNALFGVQISDAPNNTVGGTKPTARNIISGNGFTGVIVENENAVGNRIQGNYIGTNVAGTASIANIQGIYISDAPNTLVGGTSSAARNLISGNSSFGIFIEYSSNQILGNYIGTDVTGKLDLGNGSAGIRIINAQNNIVGGTSASARNIISGNDGGGINIGGGLQSASDSRIQGNYIGPDVSGSVVLGNGLFTSGITLTSAPRTIIGGVTTATRNVISGNSNCGISVLSEADDTVIAGNYVGTDAKGSLDMGNGLCGILIDDSADVVIGGTVTGAGNRIAYNGNDGVMIVNGGSARILGNAIFSNDDLGIDLGADGITVNDGIGLDSDMGPNSLQNFPSLTNIAGRSLSGSLLSQPNSSYRLEFFAVSACDISGFGEGERFLGRAVVVTDGSGYINFTVNLKGSVPNGWRVTSTATDLFGNTSEFSPCLAYPTPPVGQPKLSTPSNNAKSSDSRPIFAWNAVAGAAAYELQIAYDPSFQTILYDVFRGDISFRPFSPLTRSETFYWRVRALDGSGNGGTWSQIRVINIML